MFIKNPHYKMKNLIIFGNQQFAELASYYIENHMKDYNICAYTVHKKYCTDPSFHGLPLVPFEDLSISYGPDNYDLFAPLSGKGLNKIRESVYNQGKKMGYKFISYISPKATVLTEKIGENCFILEDNTIQPFVEIGNNCVLWSGNHIGHHTKIHNHVFITSHVVISGNCIIEPYSWFGVNSTLRNGLNIREGSLIGMSACVTKDTEPYTIYMGLPAKPMGKSDDEKVANSL